MTRLPTSRPSRALAQRPPGALAQRSPGAIDYEPADAVGYDRLPQQVRDQMANLLDGAEVAASANDPETKKRPDGSHYRAVEGWWASVSRFVEINARQELQAIGDNHFRPSGAWHVSARVDHFPPNLELMATRWRFDAAGSGLTPGKQRKADDALDALPPKLAAPVVGGLSDAWRESSRGWAQETIVAARVVEGRVRILKATREATSGRALTSTDWLALTLEAPIASTDRIDDSRSGRQLNRTVSNRQVPGELR